MTGSDAEGETFRLDSPAHGERTNMTKRDDARSQESRTDH
jgi:hypothetical protein